MLLSLVVSAVSRSFPDVETVSTSWLGDRLEAASGIFKIIMRLVLYAVSKQNARGFQGVFND